jgi:hypothetical protein
MAGALYLINIVLGAFAIGIVPAIIAVGPDAAATAHNIQTHELLYRLGLAAHVVVTVTNVPLAVIFYDLFKVVNRRLALLDAFFILVATAIEAAGLLHQFAPLVLLSSGSSTSAPAAQLQALAYAPGSALSGIDYSIHTVFFGFDILCVAYLVLRSTFLPRAIGVVELDDVQVLGAQPGSLVGQAGCPGGRVGLGAIVTAPRRQDRRGNPDAAPMARPPRQHERRRPVRQRGAHEQSERACDGPRGQHLLQRDLFAELGIGVEHAVMVVLDRDHVQGLKAGCPVRQLFGQGGVEVHEDAPRLASVREAPPHLLISPSRS